MSQTCRFFRSNMECARHSLRFDGTPDATAASANQLFRRTQFPATTVRTDFARKECARHSLRFDVTPNATAASANRVFHRTQFPATTVRTDFATM